MYRDKLCKLQWLNLNSIRAKLILATVRYNSITSSHIIKSFQQCGLWPIKFQFMELANNYCEGTVGSEAPEGERLSD